MFFENATRQKWRWKIEGEEQKKTLRDHCFSVPILAKIISCTQMVSGITLLVFASLAWNKWRYAVTHLNVQINGDYEIPWGTNDTWASLTLLVVTVSLGTLYVLMSSVLLLGIVKENFQCLTAWMTFAVYSLILTAVHIAAVITKWPTADKSFLAVSLTMDILNMVFLIFGLWVVYRAKMSIEQHGLEFSLPRVVALSAAASTNQRHKFLWAASICCTELCNMIFVAVR